MPFSESRKPIASQPEAHEPGRGRHATEPGDLPAKGWLDILWRTGRRISTDNVSIVAAGVGFYAFVAVVPALGALIGIYGLVFDPSQVTGQITALAKILPQEVLPLIEQQLRRIASNTHAASWSTILGLLIALASSASAIKALIQGLNICYEEREKRSFVKLNGLALLLTIGAVVGAIFAITLIAAVPPLLRHLPITQGLNTAFNWVRWPIVVAGFIGAMAIVFRYGPSRNDARWSWVSWGAIMAAVLWVIGSALFSLYVSRFGSYDKTYGSLGAVVVFMMWLYLSAFAILVGAELNSEMERQTLRDTTVGPEKPLGQRGARAADTVGPARDSSEDEKTRPPKGTRRAE